MNVQLFYHAAVMGKWRRVIGQQARLFRKIGLRPMIGAVGPKLLDFSAIGDVMFHENNVRLYETPTLQRLWGWCRKLNNPSEWCVIYCHTKGVAHCGPNRNAWRLLMEEWVLRKWRENLPLMDDHDVIGVNYVDRGTSTNFSSHFAGNFWMARADWICKLMPPARHAKMVRRRRRRFSPEMWVLTKPGYRYVSLCCEGVPLAKFGNSIRIRRGQSPIRIAQPSRDVA